MILITINEYVTLTGHGEVVIDPRAKDVPAQELWEAIELALSHVEDEELRGAASGGGNPFRAWPPLTLNEYVAISQNLRLAKATEEAKRRHTKIRRSAFNAQRSQLVLAMIEAGKQYVCSKPGCGSKENLTIDHLIPLSRGGADDLQNLRFMCRAHNGIKRDTIEGR